MIEPLTTPEIDLRDFQFMPLDVVRLRDSDLAVLACGEEFRAAVLLWCAAWHQVPAGSLPDHESILAHLAGFGRDLEAYREVAAQALRGFRRATDGRLYHPVICEKATEAFERKEAQRARTRKATKARENKKKTQNENVTVQRDDERHEIRNGKRNVHQGKGREGKKREESEERKIETPTSTESKSDDSRSDTKGYGKFSQDENSANDEKGKANGSKTKRGTRLAANWKPTFDERAVAAEAGLPESQLNFERAKFRDYWIAQPGQRGVKLDWDATWRNWLRRAAEQSRGGTRNGGPVGGAEQPGSFTAALGRAIAEN